MTHIKKLASQGDFERVQTLIGEGKTYSEIAQLFASEGYVSEHRGRPVSSAEISKFMIGRGYRMVNRRSIGKQEREESKVQEIVAVLSCSLSDALKLKTISTIVKG